MPAIGGNRVWLLAWVFANQLTGGIRRVLPEQSFQPVTLHLYQLGPGTRPDHRFNSIVVLIIDVETDYVKIARGWPPDSCAFGTETTNSERKQKPPTYVDGIVEWAILDSN